MTAAAPDFSPGDRAIEAERNYSNMPMKTISVFLAAVSALAMHAAVKAEPGGSLQDKRLGIINGTWPGVVIIGSERKNKPAAAAASSAAGASAAVAGKTASSATTLGVVERGAARKAEPGASNVETKSAAERAAATLKWGEAPSGQPLNSARRLDSPTQGITLPFASPAASQPAGKSPSKPGN